MVASLLNLICICYLLGVQCIFGFTIDCSHIVCDNSFINCAPRQDCFIKCLGTRSCTNSIINCPVNGLCDIQCSGRNACEGTTIDATLSHGDFHLVCDHTEIQAEASEYCKGIKIYGNTATLTNNNQMYNFNIQCNGNYRACIDSQIICPTESNCSISCNSEESCKSSMITGPNNGYLAIQCNGKVACYNSIFNAALSSQLNIKGCHQYKSCYDVSLYCPPNTNGHVNCIVEGNDNLGIDPSILPATSPPTLISIAPSVSPSISPSNTASNTPTDAPSVSPTPFNKGIKIYAINGWNDINIQYTGTFSQSHKGQMFCGDTYAQSCSLANNDWRCHGVDHICAITNPNPNINTNPIIITNPPTAVPTITITNNPTSAPTHDINNINSTTTIESNNIQNTTYFTQITPGPTTSISTMNTGTSTSTSTSESTSTSISNPIATTNETATGTNTMHMTSTQQMAYSYSRTNGDIFIVIGVCILILTCCGVGYAQIRKNISDAKKLTAMYHKSNEERNRINRKYIEKHINKRKNSKHERLQSQLSMNGSGRQKSLSKSSVHDRKHERIQSQLSVNGKSMSHINRQLSVSYQNQSYASYMSHQNGKSGSYNIDSMRL